MAKLILLFATLALFVLLVNASIYRTTVELDEEDNQGQQGRCRREFQQQQRLRACQQYIRHRAQRGPFEDELEIDELDDEVENQGRPWLRRCCNELHQVDRQCICPVLRHAAQEQRFQGQYEGPQLRRLFRAARNLPNRCNIPVGTCPFTARPYAD